jgi:hypothetical protein
MLANFSDVSSVPRRSCLITSSIADCLELWSYSTKPPLAAVDVPIRASVSSNMFGINLV